MQTTMKRFLESSSSEEDEDAYLIFLCKKQLPGVNFYRFNAKNWQFTVQIGNLLCKLAIYCVNFGVNFILQKFCMCKKMTIMRYALNLLIYSAVNCWTLSRCCVNQMLKIVNLLCKLAIDCVNFGINFILHKFCMCKKILHV